MSMINISEASKMLGVDVRTLQRWDNEGKLKAYRTLGGHRRYKSEEIEELLGKERIQNTNSNVFIYSRVSTKKQQKSGNLDRQKERLIQYCNEKGYNIVGIYQEVASGLNDNRRELTKMFRKLNEADRIIIEHPDRLARFGYHYLEEYAKAFNVTLEAIEHKNKLEPNEEMVNDLISIVTCFSARLYGARGGKKIKKDLKKSIGELEKQGSENYEGHNESNADS